MLSLSTIQLELLRIKWLKLEPHTHIYNHFHQQEFFFFLKLWLSNWSSYWKGKHREQHIRQQGATVETGDKPSCTQDPLIRSLWSFYQQIKFRWLPWSCSVFSFSVKGLCLLSTLKHLFPASMNTSNKKNTQNRGKKTVLWQQSLSKNESSKTSEWRLFEIGSFF